MVTDLRARNFAHARISLRARCVCYTYFFSPLISIIQLYNKLHYKYLQNLQDIWNLQKFNTTQKLRLNSRDRKLEEYLKNLISRPWAWFFHVESTSFIICFKFQVSKCYIYLIKNWEKKIKIKNNYCYW